MKKGSYDVRPAPTYRCGWKLRCQTSKDNKKKTEIIPQEALAALGFSLSMTLEEARARASQLNASESLESKTIRAAVSRVIQFEKEESAYLPKLFVDRFQEAMTVRKSASEHHKRKLVSHWKYLSRMIKELKLLPKDYKAKQGQIYDYFADKRTSPEYAVKLVALLNKFGAFYSEKTAQFFNPIEKPKGRDLSLIADAYLDSEGYRGESDPLTPELLEAKQQELRVKGNLEWLQASVWFGLRPYEINNLIKADPKKWRIEHDIDLGVDVLMVYQSKLMGIAREKRWKRIPVFCQEQKEALEIIKQGGLKQPLYKTMDKVFDGKRITLYGGRKGFLELMLAKKQTIEDISMWMGHQSIETTWIKYRNRKMVSFSA